MSSPNPFLKKISLIKKFKGYLKNGYCFHCKGFKRHSNEKLNKCSCEISSYPKFVWIDYCNKYGLNSKTGNKSKK